MKKSVKDQTARAFQVGGYNPPSIPQQPYTQPTQVNPQTGTYVLPGTGIAGYQIPTGAPTGFTPYGGATPYFQPVQFTGAQYQTALQTTNLPTFAETVGQRAGQYDELRTYINDAGQTLQIPFKDGRPIYPIPEGYRPIGDQPAPEEQEQTTVTPTLGETTVRDEGGGDRDVGVSGTGYKGLSTTRGTGTGGLSAAAAKAQSDLGLTGFAGIPAGGTLGAIASTFGFDVPTAFGKAPQSGMTGTLDQATLEAVAKGAFVGATGQSAIGLSQQQALNVMEYQQNYGVTLNGIIGYQNGNVSPNTGTPVRNGMTVDSAFGPNAQPEYSSFQDMMDTISRGNKSGWRGGVVSEDTYNDMTPEQQSRYRDFDPEMAKEFDNRAMGLDDSPDPGTGRTGPESAAGAGEYRGGPTGFEGQPDSGPSDPGVSDTPDADTGMTEAEAGAGAGDFSGFGAGQDSRGDDSDTGRGSGGGGSSDGSSGGSSCFAAGTKFFMEDGSLKNIEDIKIGDVLQKGGKVRTTIVGDGLYEEWYMYGNTKVTGTHTVFENGTWKRVADSDNATPTEKDEFIYTLVNEKHRLIAEDGVMYGDYDEVDNLDIEDGLLEMMNLQDSVDQAA